MTKALVSLSGGIDSAVTLFLALEQKREVMAFGFRYGSKHNLYENGAASKICQRYKIPFKIINMEEVMRDFKSALLLDGGEIPEGDYKEENMAQTVVPARNLIFASILAGIAESNDCQEVWMGTHGGDHFIYPDCRPESITAISLAINLCTGGKVRGLVTPIEHMTKAEVVAEGIRLGVPFELTRTCYKNQVYACGKCGSCRERLEAFEKNNHKDPITYEKEF